MASFQANIGWEMPKKRENKNYHSDQFQPNPLQRIRKKQQKNSKDKKNIILASSQPKIGWERPRKRENKNYRSDQFLPDSLQRIPKKQQKNKKKHHYGFFSTQNKLGNAEKYRK